MRFFAGLVFALSLVIAGASAAAAQDDREAARAEFERGRSAFEAGAFREALDHFQEAYRLAPHPNVRVNIANCYDQLDRPIEALFHFEHYLSEAERPPAAQRREVETAIARLRQRVGAITLQITPDGAQITIDGTETRRAPVPEPVRVVAGPHTVEVQLEGYRTERQTVVVEGGGTARVALRLSRAEAVASTTTTGGAATTASTATTGAAVTTGSATTTSGSTSAGTGAATASATTTSATTTGATSEPATAQTETTATSGGDAALAVEVGPDQGDGQDTGGGGLRITLPVIIAGSVTAAALVAAAIFGPLALSANGSFENAVTRANDPGLSEADRAQARLDGEGAASDARTFAVVADVMLITAAVGAGVAVALFIVAQGEGEGDDAVAVLPVLGPEQSGVVLTGRF